MRNLIISLLVMSVFALTSCDGDDDKMFLPPGAGGGDIPADIVNDVEDTGEFEYETVQMIEFDLSLQDADGNPLAKVVVTLNSDEGEISKSITDENGNVTFKVTVKQVDENLYIKVEHPEYKDKTVVIENAQNISKVERTIFLEKKEIADKPEDRDGDGVPDDSDDFPDDPELIGSVVGEYTIAYEDLWPRKGDADFNDLVVKLGIEEFINPDNMISKIIIKSKTLAAGAGYKNLFLINILGKDYLLISNPKKDLKGKWNARAKDKYVDGPVHTMEIVLDNPVSRDDLAPMPYDPYIKCNGNSKNQVHLSFVESKWEGKVLDQDQFPWAVLVPADWAWPKEKSNMFKAYPDFEKWYKSGGEDFKEWYLNPDTSHVFNVGIASQLAAYMLKVTTEMNKGVAAGILLTMVLMLLGINMWRKRSEERVKQLRRIVQIMI